jgi:hypothetical protein
MEQDESGLLFFELSQLIYLSLVSHEVISYFQNNYSRLRHPGLPIRLL